MGACITQSGAVDCAPFACAAGACLTSCATDADCQGGTFCDQRGDCVASLSLGQACTASSQCGSGYCVDGVCCNEPCNSQCQACDVSGFTGTCTGAQGAPRGSRPPCAGASGACAGRCDGVAPTCVYPGATVECDAACTAGRQTLSTCDGQGTCAAGSAEPCPGNLVCGADRCLTDCAADGDCATGFRCSSGACIPAAGQCVDDDRAVEDVNGARTDCAPYFCVAGQCRDSCSSTTDCQSGSVCDTGQGQGQCRRAASAPVAADEGGCGCRQAPAGLPWRGAAGVALLAVAALRRRRSRRTRPARAA